MEEQPIKEPVKEEPKKNILTLVIDLDALSAPQQFIIPPDQDIWHNQEEMGEDYQKFMNALGIMMIYIARSCNEGPEIKENPTKRIITIKTLLDMFFQNLNISGYMAYGLLTEILHDTYMRISGKQQTIKLLKHIQRRNERKAKEKAQSYTS
jgi:hypothetical protein